MEISKKALVALLCVLSITGLMGAYAATVIYNIKFNTATTEVPAVQVEVNGVLTTDLNPAPVGSVVTITATLDQALSGVSVQFSKNGANLGAPVLTNAVGVASIQYTVLQSDAGTTLTWGAVDTTL